MSTLAERWVRFADRHRRALLGGCAVAALAGAVGTVRLYSDLRPDLSELLPARSRSAVDAATVAARMGGLAEESVVLSGADPMTLEIAADDLVDALSQAPPGLIGSLEARLDPLRDFFLPRLLLFPSREDLSRLRDRLAARIAWERTRAGGGTTGEGPPPDVEGLLEELSGRAGDLAHRFPEEGYVRGQVPGRRPGETMNALAVVVRLKGSPDDYGRVRALDRAVRAAVASIEPERRGPGFTVGYGGYVASNIHEHEALAEDLVWATALVVLAVAAAVAFYNRTWKAVPAVGLPLLCGTLVTFGLADLLVGHLNTNTAFLGSIVVGNGINVGLILFARYLEERRRGGGPRAAMEKAVGHTWLAGLTAALAAGVSYASLLTTDFRGFNQFGLIGGTGMALCWLFAYLMTPPLVLAWERLAPIPRPGQRPAHPLFTQVISAAVSRAPRALAVLAALLSAASVALVVRLARDPIEHDFRKLRDQTALRPGGPAWWDERVDALHGGHLSPTVLLGRDAAEARRIARAVEAHRRSTPGTLLGEVLSVDELVPEGQEAKLGLVGEIRSLATPENLAFLPPDKRAVARKLIPPADLRPFGPGDLPEVLRSLLTERTGEVGAPVLVYPTASMDPWNGRSVVAFAAELRSIPMPRPDVPMASSTLVFADVLEAIEHDGPRATVLSLAGVVGLVLVAFGLGRRSVRSLGDAGWVLASLGMGIVWFGGLAGALHLRLNMLNFIALPITFGIGVDYATNVFQRRRLDHARSIGDVIRTTGGAVGLCSLTTVIGYSSLLAARNQALISFGLLAVLGEVACLAAAVLALPAVLRWRELAGAGRTPPGGEAAPGRGVSRAGPGADERGGAAAGG
ncbi:MAG TPA: MMPL family transporter [Anaeromyxobacter sp.]|nr:MMPL family transporter [Anaeromyxobacter sp.]